jgi:hypothetical protein
MLLQERVEVLPHVARVGGVEAVEGAARGEMTEAEALKRV